MSNGHNRSDSRSACRSLPSAVRSHSNDSFVVVKDLMRCFGKIR